jgi:hypothetical protein
MGENNEPVETSGSSENDDSGMSEGEIDLNLIETFPASDPPSWTLGTDHHEETRADQSSDESEAENQLA